RMDADALDGGSTEDWQELAGARALVQPGPELLGRELGPLEILLEQLVVRFRDGLDELIAGRSDLVGERRRRLRFLDLLVLVDVGLAGEEIDDAFEAGLGADRHLEHGGLHAERLQVLERVGDARALAIESCDEAHAREPQLVAPSPQLLGFDLDLAAAGPEDEDRAGRAIEAVPAVVD